MTSGNKNVVPVPPYNLEKSVKHWLRKLQEDYGRIERSTRVLATHQSVPTPLVEYIFIISKKLNLSLEVKYLTVDLFDRFIRNQFKIVYSDLFSNSSKHNSKRWEKVEAKICCQIELRVLSCIQIASKFISENSSSSKILTSKEIHELLDEEESFSICQINSSEFRVFKTLDFQINGFTIISFVDGLIISIYKHLYGTPGFEHLQGKCYQMCEILYLNHQEIFNNFYHQLTGLWERSYKERLSFSSVECNGLIKSAAVILTAAKLATISDEKEKILRKELSKLTTSSEECIDCLSKVILRVIFS